MGFRRFIVYSLAAALRSNFSNNNPDLLDGLHANQLPMGFRMGK
jgi:hypothetical protein